MANKLVTGILVLLVVVTGGLGYYSFTLNRQLDDLNARIASFQDEQSALVRAVSDNVAALRSSTESSLSSLDTKIGKVSSDLADAQERLSGVTENISTISSQINSLSRLSGSVIDSTAVYQKAVRATVRITDGEAMAGSGFIYDNEGRVVTAYHVVKDLSPIYIMTYDGQVIAANVTGSCQFSDIAVLKPDSNPSLEPISLADSGKINVGDPVITIGSPGSSESPLGLRDTLTSGIISQVNRYVDVEGVYIANLLQFDAAVNFGNSGGPLIDTRGRVIGVINARIDPTQGDGIYWAIASNKVKRVADAIIATGSFAYPFIGTGISDLTPQEVRDKSLDTANGALVGNIVSGGPADTAGIKAGDIIISMDGIPMRNVADLTSYLGEFLSPGNTTIIEVIRGKAKMKMSVTVGKRTP
jgi:S1-C subfamily serine protease